MKCENCPECKAELSQSGYDMQVCPCGWGPFGVASKAVKPQQFDRARETSRRQSAVELLLSMGFVWNNGKWEFRK